MFGAMEDQVSIAVDESEAVDLSQRSPAMKSSRRKQSKPIRMHKTGEPGEEQVESTDNRTITPPVEEEEQEENGSNSEEPADQLAIVCPVCGITGSDLEQMQSHISEQHSSQPTNVKLDQQSSPPAESRRQPSGGSTPALEPAKANGTDTSGDEKKQIFHPEAYCELCDREFCNKYFLKTHKANKHGIRDPNSPAIATTSLTPQIPTPSFLSSSSVLSGLGNPTLPPVIPAPPPYPGFLPHLNLTSSNKTTETSPSSTPSKSINSTTPITATADPSKEDYCEICKKNFCNKYYLKKHKQEMHNIVPEDSPRSGSTGFPPLSASSDTPTSLLGSTPTIPPLPMNPLMMPPGLPSSANNVMLFNPFMSPVALLQPGAFSAAFGQGPGSVASLAAQAANGSTSPSADTEEAYCTICKKEFCNKYFLKNHVKAKHGGIEALENGTEKKEEKSTDNGTEKENGSRSSTPQSPNKDVTSSSVTTTLTSQVGVTSPSTLSDMYSVNMLAGGARSGGLTGGLSGGLSSAIMPNPLNLFNATQAVKLSERVECEICRKEVCNKYFLKTHMQKAHGINPDDIKSSDKTKEKLESSSLTSTEAKVGKILSGIQESVKADRENATVEERSHSNQQLIEMGIDPEAYCHICKKEFCSKYFLRTHKANMHGIKLDSSQSKNQRPRIRPEDQWTKPALNTTRVSCDLCGKDLPAGEYWSHSQVCNKYFLKTHKQKKHGLDQPIEIKPQIPLVSSAFASYMPLTLDPAHALKPADTDQPQDLSLKNTPLRLDSTTTNGGSHHTNSSDTRDNTSPKTNFSEDVAECGKCKQTFSDQTSLQLHTFKHHTVRSDRTKRRMFTCSQCSFKSLFKNNVKSHEQRRHGITKPIARHSCNVCTARFVKRVSLKRHIRSRHPQLEMTSVLPPEHHTLEPMMKRRRLESRDVGLSAGNSRFCKLCGLASRSVRFLLSHLSMRHGVKQPFEAEDRQHSVQTFKLLAPSDGELLSTVVSLPVRQQLPEDLKLTVTLMALDKQNAENEKRSSLNSDGHSKTDDERIDTSSGYAEEERMELQIDEEATDLSTKSY